MSETEMNQKILREAETIRRNQAHTWKILSDIEKSLSELNSKMDKLIAVTDEHRKQHDSEVNDGK